MTRRSFLSVTPALGWTVLANSQQQKRLDTVAYPYNAAFCSTNRAMGLAQLVIFPFDRPSFSIPLPTSLHGHAYGPDGRTLYTGGEGGVCKIEFNPTRVSLVKGSDGFGVGDIAVSRDQNIILISGVYKPRNENLKGVFQVSSSTGEIRQVLTQQEYNAKSRWGYISLSPDGKRATALHNYKLHLINLSDGATKEIGDGLELGSWSPDGRWLAALESGGQQRTILMDANNFEKRRILGTSDLAWSPDSRYLLGWKKHDLCGSYWGTLEMIDIESGKRSVIKSSKCKVNQPTTGWINSDITG